MRNTIEMAREAGIYHAFDSEGHWDGLTDVKLIEPNPHHNDIVYGEKRTVEILKAFEALVRADELANIDPSKMMSYQEGFEAGRFAEREACAKVCDEMEEKAEEHGTECCKWPTPSDCAFAIRARGNT
jgi:hypothetical protein